MTTSMFSKLVRGAARSSQQVVCSVCLSSFAYPRIGVVARAGGNDGHATPPLEAQAAESISVRFLDSADPTVITITTVDFDDAAFALDVHRVMPLQSA